MESNLSPYVVNLLIRQAGEMKTHLGLDGLPPHVLANLYEGLMKEPARIHINRLQDATSSLKHLKFGRGQATGEQWTIWMQNTVQTMELAYRLIKQTLDTMYQQAPAHFRDSLQQRQEHLRYLKEYIPKCIAGFAGAEQILGNWNQMVGLSDSSNSAATSAFNLDAIAQSQAAAVQMWKISSRTAHRYLNPEDTFVVRPHNSTNYFYY